MNTISIFLSHKAIISKVLWSVSLGDPIILNALNLEMIVLKMLLFSLYLTDVLILKNVSCLW